jgi:hypothetical protein
MKARRFTGAVTAGDVRIARSRLIVTIAALLAATTILWLASSFTFYYDEWTFITTAPAWSWATYLQPHNEHPVMLTRAIYAVLLSTVGLRSYLPYMAVLLALHAASVVLIFEIVRRRAGDLVALGVAALLLLLGAGWENLLWAFQLQFVGSVACGLGMLLALQGQPRPRNLLIAATLLTTSLMFSGVGLFFGVAAAVQLAATPERRRDLIWFIPTAVALVAWYGAFGRSYSPATALSLADIATLPLYVVWGLGASAGGLVGVSGYAGLAIAALAAVAVGYSWTRSGRDGFRLGVVAGLVSFYAVTGLIRVQLGYQQSGASRYTYEGAIFWLLLLGDAARYLPWRGTWRPALVSCLLLACISSGVLLQTSAAAKAVLMQRQIADLQALAAERDDPCLDPNGEADPMVMPVETRPALYYRAVDLYGDPSRSLPVVDRADFDGARANLAIRGCKRVAWIPIGRRRGLGGWM